MKRSRFAWLLLGLASFLVPVAAAAQTPSYKATFTASPDHSTVEQQVPLVDRYELLVFAPGSTTALPAIPLGKPTPDATNLITVTVNGSLVALPASPTCNPTTPTAAQCYTAKVRAVGLGGEGVSALSDPFPLVPRSPSAAGKPGISRQ